MNKKQLSIFLVSMAVFLLFLFFTSPYKMPLIFVILPSIAFITAMHSLLTIITGYLPLRKKLARSIVMVLTVIMAVVAVLLSVGQLTFRDFSLLLALALLGMFYLSRMLDR